MIVNFEFLDHDSIENVITCLHYKVDEVIFFGFKEVITEKSEMTEKFLKKYCGVKKVFFEEISQTKLNKVVTLMKKKIEEKQKENHQCFIDITGGEGIALLAFGMLKKELDIPMHMYDVSKDELIEYNVNMEGSLSALPEKYVQHVPMDLDVYIEMQGGKIRNELDSSYRPLEYSKMVCEDIRALWAVYKRNLKNWNHFSTVIARYSVGLEMDAGAAVVRSDLASQRKEWFFEKLPELLSTCERAGLLKHVVCDNSRIAFSYKNEFVKMCMMKAGNILEQYVYLLEKDSHNDCRIGVHLDWDDIVQREPSKDVRNEIDVLVLDGYIPTFISCKGGKVDQMPLYELETVASRFGGKYAKRNITVTQEMKDAYVLRAKEMGIEVRKL